MQRCRWVAAHAAGAERRPGVRRVQATARGEAEQYAPNDGSAATNSRSAQVAVNFLGNVVYDRTSTTACGSTSYSSCASYGISCEKTFFHAEQTFTLGPVPV